MNSKMGKNTYLSIIESKEQIKKNRHSWIQSVLMVVSWEARVGERVKRRGD